MVASSGCRGAGTRSSSPSTGTYLDRHFAQKLPAEMRRIHDDHFHILDTADFARLVRIGKTKTYRPGEVMVRQGEDNRYVRLVLHGNINVYRDDRLTYQINEGSFISEVGLHAGLLLRGEVESCGTIVVATKKGGAANEEVDDDDNVVRVLEWDRTALSNLLEHDHNIRRSLKALISWDIISKLKSQQQLLLSGTMDAVADANVWTLTGSLTIPCATCIIVDDPRYRTSTKKSPHTSNNRHHRQQQQQQQQ